MIIELSYRHLYTIQIHLFPIGLKFEDNNFQVHDLKWYSLFFVNNSFISQSLSFCLFCYIVCVRTLIMESIYLIKNLHRKSRTNSKLSSMEQRLDVYFEHRS